MRDYRKRLIGGAILTYILLGIFSLTFPPVTIWFIFSAVKHWMRYRKDKDILNHGDFHWGLVVEYDDSRQYVGGSSYELALIVLYKEEGEYKVIFVPARTFNESAFPLGRFVDFCVYNNEARLYSEEWKALPESMLEEEALDLWEYAYGKDIEPLWTNTDFNTEGRSPSDILNAYVSAFENMFKGVK